MRNEVLKNCFIKAAVSYRKKFSADQVDSMVDVSTKTLACIPTDLLEDIFDFDLGRRTGLRGFPSDRDLLESYGLYRDKNRSRLEWNEQKIKHYDFEMYTWRNIPWIFKSDRMRFLLEKKLKSFTPEEESEWESQYENMEWRREDLRINETLKKKIENAENDF